MIRTTPSPQHKHTHTLTHTRFAALSTSPVKATMSGVNDDDDGICPDVPSTFAMSTESSKAPPREIQSVNPPELSQIPEELTSPSRRRKRNEHQAGMDIVRVFVSNKEAKAGTNNKNKIVPHAEPFSKRSFQNPKQASQRSLISISSSSHVAEADTSNDINDVLDSSSVMSRRTAWSHCSRVAGASDWSIRAEPDSRVSGLVREWEILIPTRNLQRREEEREEHWQSDDSSGHVALTEAALEQFSNERGDDGAAGPFSMSQVVSNTATAERIAQEINAVMAWWKDHGFDMKASGDVPSEAPPPLATLEDSSVAAPDWRKTNQDIIIKDEKPTSSRKLVDVLGRNVSSSIGGHRLERATNDVAMTRDHETTRKDTTNQQELLKREFFATQAEVLWNSLSRTNVAVGADRQHLGTVNTDVKLESPLGRPLAHGKPTEQARQEGPKDPLIGKSTRSPSPNPETDNLDDLKEAQLELGIKADKNEAIAEGSEEDAEKALEAELQTIRWELGIDTGDGQGGNDRAAKSNELDLLELGTSGSVTDAKADASNRADTAVGKNVAVHQDLSKGVGDHMPTLGVQANPQDFGHVLAVCAVAPEDVASAGPTTVSAFSHRDFSATPQVDLTANSSASTGETCRSSRSSSRITSIPGAVAVLGIQSILCGLDDSSSTSVASQSRSAEVTTRSRWNPDGVVVADPSDVLVSATLVDQTDTGVLAAIVNGEPVSASPLPRQESLDGLLQSRWVRATACLSLFLRIALVALTAVSISVLNRALSRPSNSSSVPTTPSTFTASPSRGPAFVDLGFDHPIGLPFFSSHPSKSPIVRVSPSGSTKPSIPGEPTLLRPSAVLGGSPALRTHILQSAAPSTSIS